MANPTRISELTDGAPVLPGDQIPIARGAGPSGQTFKVLAGSLLTNLLSAGDTATIDMSFDQSTRTFTADAKTIPVNKGGTALTTTPTNGQLLIGNSTGYTLNTVTGVSGVSITNGPGTIQISGDQLLTLIRQLSTNMQNIGNYPYLEYAWVTAPNAGGQTISSGIWNTLNLNTEVADTGNFGSLASNQITLSAGTYRFAAYTNLVLYYAAQTVFALYNVSDDKYISTISDHALSNYGGVFEGQFVLNSSKILDFRLGYHEWQGRSAAIKEDNVYGHGHSISTSNSSFRTAIKLWKVG